MRFDAVIFDMDGLLLDTETVMKSAFMETCKHFHIEKEPVFYNQLIGLNSDSNAILIEDFLDGHVALETFRKHWRDSFSQAVVEEIPVKSGARPFLEYLTQAGVPCAVATSSKHEKAKMFLDRVNLLQHFEFVVGGDQVENGKPHPEIYLTAAKTLSVNAEQCIAFEDSKNGVKSAIGAGMTVVQVLDLIEPDEELIALDHLIVDNILDGARHYKLYHSE